MNLSERESRLRAPIIAYLQRRGFRHVMTEAQFYEHRIDVYAYSQRDNATVAIELKLSKWKKAVQQAILYQLCADVALVALPVKAASRVDLDLLRTHGIGLIAIAESGTCKEVLAPAKSDVLLPHYRVTYTNQLVASKTAKCQRSIRE